MTKWKSDLQQAFTPPPPNNKRAFLSQAPAYNMELREILLSQLCYTPKWVWVLSALVYAAAVLMLSTDFPHLLQALSACTPLLAMTVVAENGRSTRYGMAELEQSTRFSLKSITAARLIPLGCMHPLVLTVLVLCSDFQSPAAAILYSTAPFLLTAFLGLHITRKHRSHEAIYTCVGITLAISLLTLLSHSLFSALYNAQHLIWWAITVAALAVGTGKVFYSILFETEDLVWN